MPTPISHPLLIVGASAGPVNSTSQQYSIDVTRTTPQLTIISDKSPNGGNCTLFCGDQSDYHFRSTNGTLPAGGVIDNYIFNFKGVGVINPTGDVPGTNPVTHFTGATGTAGVNLSARYTRNGASTSVYASNVAITVQSPPQPIITNSVASPGPGLYPLLCGSSATLTLTLSTSVPGATSYTWTATGGLGINGPGVTTLTTSSNSVTIFPGSGSGEGLVTVATANGNIANCASSTSAGYGVAYGGAYKDGSAVMYSDQFDYSGCPDGCAGICPGSRVTM